MFALCSLFGWKPHQEPELLPEFVDMLPSSCGVIGDSGKCCCIDQIGPKAIQGDGGPKAAVEHGRCIRDPNQRPTNHLASKVTGFITDFWTHICPRISFSMHKSFSSFAEIFWLSVTKLSR